MEIIEKIKTNKSIDNQTEIQKICLDKLQSNPLPSPKSEQWRLSNKSKFSNFLDYSVNEKNPKGRDIGTLAISCLCSQFNIDIVRVHNVELNYQILKVADRIYRK